MPEYGKWWVTLNLLGLLLVSPVAPLKIGDPWVFDGFPRKVHFGADFTSADQVLRIHMRCVAAVAPQIVQICTVCFKSNPWKSKLCKTTILKYLLCIHTYVLHELLSKPFNFFKYQSLVRSMGVSLPFLVEPHRTIWSRNHTNDSAAAAWPRQTKVMRSPHKQLDYQTNTLEANVH